MKLTSIIHIISISVSSFLCISCASSQTEILFESQTVIKKDTVNSIAGTIGQKQWDAILNTNTINIFKIDSVLVDKISNEYGRKVSQIKDAQEVDVTIFLSQLQLNKGINRTNNKPFNPSYFFEMCADECDNSILLDLKNKKISFVSLQGQFLFSVDEDFNNYLKKLPTSKQ